ncbi:MAG: ABC-type multidrug transport system ATPase subunit [Sulfurimonas sp.]|jgi:ABC-type multidrug transport system ATPase subunit
MDSLSVHLENCYGIRLLKYDFDLKLHQKNKGVYSIYAPNGFMKSSLARTFNDLANVKSSQDLIFPERETKVEILADKLPINPDDILVIKPYEESYSSKQMSLLLVNDTLKEQYDSAVKSIESKKNDLEKAIRKLSGISGRKQSALSMLCQDFGRKEKELYKLLEELCADDIPQYSDIEYQELFNDKTLPLLKSGTISTELYDYIQTYDKLVENSPILSKEFNHQNAQTISKSLNDTGFFSASHTVNLNINGEKKEFTSHSQLQKRVTDEQNKVFDNEELSKKFEAVDKKLGGSADTKRFRAYLDEHKNIVPKLADYTVLQKDLWQSYIASKIELCKDLLETYAINKAIILGITTQANKEKTSWERVVQIFNRRFNVPFKVSVDNQEDVILHSAVPSIAFNFNDGREEKPVNEKQLLEVLSQGERRALYLLNILFELEARKNHPVDVLLIIDDIADSFDYKNKYAIIEYLKELADQDKFNILFLTHNFDFHRTICSRVGIYGEKRLFTTKNAEGIQLIQEKYQKDVLTYWKSQLHRDPKCVLACIPFARNLAEYCGKKDEYNKLTALLHLKPETSDIRVSDLQSIYQNIFVDRDSVELQNPTQTVHALLQQESQLLVDSENDMADLEHKIIIAISIRLLAESYMIRKINNAEFVSSITTNQTAELFNKFTQDHGDETKAIELLEQVNIITPENIHLNSFMYEPILDMSVQQLVKLYKSVKKIVANL